MGYVFDTSAAIAWLRDEPGASVVRAILDTSHDLHMHAVNSIEVDYKFAAGGGDLAGREAVRDLVEAGIKIHENLDPQLRERASFFKTRYPFLSLGDSICIALADRTGSTIVASDQAFRKVGDGIELLMIREQKKS